jgi:hypothetical protein
LLFLPLLHIVATAVGETLLLLLVEEGRLEGRLEISAKGLEFIVLENCLSVD